MTTKRRILLAITGVIALALIAVAVYLGLGMHARQQYSEKVSIGDRYMNTGDYTNAVLAYREAIELDPQDGDAYLSLAQLYMLQGDNANARLVLEDGISKTGSARLQLLLNNLVATMEDGKGQGGPGEATFNNGLLSIFGNNSYGDYKNRNNAGAGTANGGSSVVRVDQLGASLTFSNNAAQPNAVVNGVVSDNSIPTEISLDNIMTLFGGGESVSYAQLQSFGLHDLLYRVDEIHNYVMVFTLNECSVTIECDSAGTVWANAWNRIVPDKSTQGSLEENERYDAVLHGRIIDAVTGDAVEGVNMAFREGYAEVGDTVCTAVTDYDGEYSANLNGGPYTVELSKDGYTTIFKEVYIGTYQTEMTQDFTISSELASGEIRIVLEWNSYPVDLDSYLGGTSDSGADLWLMYANREERDPNGNLVASLDLDCRSGFGPETTTIYDINGSYEFTVADYNATDQMAQNGATVTVYMPGEAPTVISLTPASGVRSIWYVCRIDHGRLEVLNSAPAEDVFSAGSK